jgi:hypothetical protein
MTNDPEEDPGGWVIRGKNLIAEVDVTAHSDLVSFFTHEGLSVSSEGETIAEMVRVHVSGEPERLRDSVHKFVEENPQVPLRVVETGTEGEGEDEGGDASPA